MRRIFIPLLLLTGMAFSAFGQTCCSGGVPLASNLGLPASGAGNLQFALNYDLNILNTLKEGTETLDDQIRNRKTHSMLGQIGYSFSNRFAVDALVTYVRQERTITNDFGGENFVSTQGIGDAVLLLKYRLWESKNQGAWTIGLGVKLATGAADKRSENDLLLNADLQPGSGASDALFWTQFTQAGIIRPSMGFFTTLTLNRRGINDNYLPVFDPSIGSTRSQAYQFGNEIQMIFGLNDRLLLGGVMIDPGLSFRFRSVRYDRLNDQRLPSTGGTWWFANPNITFWPNDQFSFNANVEFPVYANIIGTQLSPSIRLNVGVFYRLSLKKDQLSPLNNPLF